MLELVIAQEIAAEVERSAIMLGAPECRDIHIWSEIMTRKVRYDLQSFTSKWSDTHVSDYDQKVSWCVANTIYQKMKDN